MRCPDMFGWMVLVAWSHREPEQAAWAHLIPAPISLSSTSITATLAVADSTGSGHGPLSLTSTGFGPLTPRNRAITEPSQRSRGRRQEILAMCSVEQTESARARPQAMIFDLDGVITDTASIHARAWKIVFDEFLAASSQPGADRPFDAVDDYLE